MANELVVMDGEQSVSLWRKPEQVLTEAKEAAQALIKVVDMKRNKVVFNGETYLEFEDWQTVAKFYGCTTKIVSTSPVEFDGVRGFEATAVVLDRHQNEIGRVDSMCLSDEENWGDVPKYEWVDVLDDKGNKIYDKSARNGKGGYKREKKEVGRSPKPLFQLRSMAQTRAQVKALRSIFSWVVVMAGYQPTPAEELTGNEFQDDGPPGEEQRKPVEMPKATQTATEKVLASGVISARAPGKDNALWVMIGEKRMAIPADKVGSNPYTVGDKVSFDAIVKQGKEGPFLVLQELHSYEVGAEETLPPMQDGPVPEKPNDELDKAIEGKFDDPVGTLQEVRRGVIGEGRQKRLWALMSQNAKKTGLTEKIVHQLLENMQPPLEHLSELPLEFQKTWEGIMTGKVDWSQLL